MEENIKKQLGEAIKTKRKELGLSQEELAKKVKKTSAAYIALIEAGERNVSTLDLMLISKELGTTVSELLGENIKGKNEKVDFYKALRSNSELSKKDREKLEDFYNFLKNPKNE